MIRKSGYRFSEKIMLKQKDRARCQFNQNPSRSGDLESQGQAYAIRTRPPTILCGVVSYATTGRPGKCDSSNRPTDAKTAANVNRPTPPCQRTNNSGFRSHRTPGPAPCWRPGLPPG